MSISLVIPLWNHLASSKLMLASLWKSIFISKLEVLFINDASQDGTSEWLASLTYDCIKIIVNDSNIGYAKSNNIGAYQASGDILVLLNNDLEFDAEWLEPMLSILESPVLNAGVVGNIQRRISDDSIDHVGFELTPQGKFVHKRALPDASIPYSKVSAVTGACLAIRRSDFEAVGGFDEGFLNGGEDVDLCLKVAALGKSIYVSHESQIKHHVALSRDLKSPQNEKNSRLLFQKWRPMIKNELSKVWQSLLSSDIAYGQNLDGGLSPAFLAAPGAAARIISENVLAREEHRWSRELDGKDLNANIDNHITVRGVRYNNTLLGYLVDDEIEITLKDVSSIQNFYVCGRKLSDAPTDRLEVIISLNGIQHKTFTLGADRHINVGIIDPILLSGMDNIFTVTFRTKAESGLYIGAGQAVVITHFVIDEKTINQF
ncbi:glycosyltransferase family 2 protein [Polynucleobacter paneuropaeus]|nr:glycosyltransferase family 2 protein [Polynucleobacter paneuropaeus]